MDTTPQIAEEQLVMTMDKTQETKLNSKIQNLAFRCFLLTSAKAKKFQDGDRLTRLYTAISLHLRRFSKIATIFYQKDSRSFQQLVQREAKQSYLQDYEVTHTHRHIAITSRVARPIPLQARGRVWGHAILRLVQEPPDVRCNTYLLILTPVRQTHVTPSIEKWPMKCWLRRCQTPVVCVVETFHEVRQKQRD